ncbi:MAG: peptide deformylase [Promethearchaeota archaeon]|jgi:peptide deformylase
MPEIITNVDELHKPSSQVDDLEIGDIIEQLSISIPNDTLGLSAPQIGIHKRVFLANLSFGSFAFINPYISWSSPDSVPSIESCLSLPHVRRCVDRRSQVDISCDKVIEISTGSVIAEPEPVRLKDQDAFIIQHERDHLDGVLIIDLPETKTSEQRLADREQKREQRVSQRRLQKESKTPPVFKAHKMSAKKLAKYKRQAKKAKRKRRTMRHQEKIRVEIQERNLAAEAGLFDDKSISPELTENQE